MADSFPRLSARTQRFTLGRPRSFSVGGGRVAFLRAASGTDPVTGLWVWDADGERLVCDPTALGADERDLPAGERARRERARETASGVTTYAVDDELTVAAFALAGLLGVTSLTEREQPRLLPAEGPVADPRPSPDGRHLGYVCGQRLVLAALDGAVLREVAGPTGTSCGVAEFIASEELGRFRGWWWSPDSTRVLAAVVDESPVQRWWIADPAQPSLPAVEHRYPAAGTPNAAVSLLLADLAGGEPRPVTGWDTTAYPYLVDVAWTAGGLMLHALSRDQRHAVVLRVDPDSAAAEQLLAAEDDAFIDIVAGAPRLLDDGRLLHAVDDATTDTRRLAIDGEPVSPPWLHLAAVRHVGDGAALVVGTAEDPASRHLYAIDLSGTGLRQLSTGQGMHDGVAGGDLLVAVATTLDAPTVATVLRGGEPVTTLRSYAEVAPLTPVVRLLRGGQRSLQIGIVLPRDHVAGHKVPVLMDPYGGPHHSEVLAAQGLWLEPQWWADQGFAVVVADGRGTPGRSLSWEKAVRGDLASPALTDQVDALHAAAAQEPDLDLDRVAIRGWSFGGYLAALAVLRRPDVFHAALAGAPVTDMTLYDTAYTERYLGTDPTGADAAAYAASSLLADAPSLRRPLLLVHGLADDNVVAAHTLRLSAALLAAGRPHDVLPLTGVTHVAGADVVAENLLLLQLSWLRRALGLPSG